MIALREGATKLGHEHFHSGIAEGESWLLDLVVERRPLMPVETVQSKKKNELQYFA